MRGRAFALGVVGLFLQLIGGFVLVVMLPIVSMGGNGGFGEHFSAVAIYLVGGAIPLIVGLKLSATNKATAIGAMVIATLAGIVGALEAAHAVSWMGKRPDEWGYWACDALFWGVDIAFAIVIWRAGFTLVRSVPSSAE